MSLNKLFLQIRTDTHLDHFDFAFILGISPKNLKQIEGEHIIVSMPTLNKLAALLAVPANYLKETATQEEAHRKNATGKPLKDIDRLYKGLPLYLLNKSVNKHFGQ